MAASYADDISSQLATMSCSSGKKLGDKELDCWKKEGADSSFQPLDTFCSSILACLRKKESESDPHPSSK